ncbi:MAG: methyltransferase domain-containing protein [Proteobacteria bacterium]|nr:methyltransferase domain-containing protein [Pseudomonadota bacterium]
MPRSSSVAVARYYAAKTDPILTKYGPGPRVHYHSGWVDPLSPPERPQTRDALRTALVAAQENLLELLAKRWAADPHMQGRVLDVGCGLGGTALFLADRFGTRVAALTNVPSHAHVVARFAHRAGLSDRVRPVVADAHAVPARGGFDAAIAIESSCYLTRDRWFAELARLLGVGSTLTLVDCFVRERAAARHFDRHYHCQLGTRNEYERAAVQAGFRLDTCESLNEGGAGFWKLSLTWIDDALGRTRAPEEIDRLQRSKRAHVSFHRAYAEYGVGFECLRFVRSRGVRATD